MIDKAFSIHPVLPLGVILSVVLVLLGFMTWNEWKRKIKYRYLRIVAVILIMVSILGILLQPTVESKQESNGIVLLTPHYKASLVDSLLKANPKLTLLRTFDAAPHPRASILENYDDLHQGIDLHFVVGDGLPDYVLTEVKTSFQFYKGELPNGIVAWLPPSNFKPNQQKGIRGTFRSSGKSTIELIGPGGVEDSVSFTTIGTHDFNLSLTPRQAGLFLYSIVTEDADKTQTQKFPVEVVQVEKLSILFVQNYPTAEARYLKNFLSEQGHSIVMRSKISKEKFRYEYANHELSRIDRLSSEALSEFDLFFIDQESLDGLSNNEKSVLEESVKQGLGLLIFNYSKDKIENSSFLSLPMKGFDPDTVRLNLGSSVYTFSTLPMVMNDISIEPITQGKGRVLSGYVNKGAGRIAFQLLQETYRLVLEGKKIEYASLWSPLVERVARTQSTRFKIEMDQPFPIFPDESLDVNVIAANATPELMNDGVLIPLREDVFIDDYWHGNAWADESGWHQFVIKEDSSKQNYYVSNQNEWRALRISHLHRANEILSQKQLNSSIELSIVKERHPVSFLIFFIVFLLAAGFLWLVPKL